MAVPTTGPTQKRTGRFDVPVAVISRNGTPLLTRAGAGGYLGTCQNYFGYSRRWLNHLSGCSVHDDNAGSVYENDYLGSSQN